MGNDSPSETGIVQAVTCACPTRDPGACFRIRYPRPNDEYEYGEVCECACHDDYDGDDDDWQ